MHIWGSNNEPLFFLPNKGGDEMKVLNVIVDCIASWLCYIFVLILYAIVEPIQMIVTLFWYIVTPFKTMDVFYEAFQKIRND